MAVICCVSSMFVKGMRRKDKILLHCFVKDY